MVVDTEVWKISIYKALNSRKFLFCCRIARTHKKQIRFTNRDGIKIVYQIGQCYKNISSCYRNWQGTRSPESNASESDRNSQFLHSHRFNFLEFLLKNFVCSFPMSASFNKTTHLPGIPSDLHIGKDTNNEKLDLPGGKGVSMQSLHFVSLWHYRTIKGEENLSLPFFFFQLGSVKPIIRSIGTKMHIFDNYKKWRILTIKYSSNMNNLNKIR